MAKKNDKRLCWNCDGNISLHLTQCPYCGVDLTLPQQRREESKEFASPFQSTYPTEDSIPKAPYGSIFDQNSAIDEKKWSPPANEKNEIHKEKEDVSKDTKQEIAALLFLLPGVVFFLFGLTLLLFSIEGTLTLKWKQSLSYFYLLGATPFLYLGWRVFR